MIRLLAILALLIGAALAQNGNTISFTASGAPTGTCSYIFRYIDSATGNEYNCKAGAWNQVGGAGGGAAGPDTAVQYKDGTVFGGDANFTWNKTTKLFGVKGSSQQGAAPTDFLAAFQSVPSNTKNLLGAVGTGTQYAAVIQNQDNSAVFGQVEGLFAAAIANQSDSSTPAIIGAEFNAFGEGLNASYLTAAQFYSEFDGAGAATSLAGVTIFGNFLGGGGTALRSYGVDHYSQAGVGTTLNAAEYFQDQGSGANDYAIYMNGSSSKTKLAGPLLIPGSSSGTATIVAPAVAGTPTLTLPTTSGTFALTGASTAFSAITSATNTTAAMVVGSGASLATSGTGTIAATSFAGTESHTASTSATLDFTTCIVAAHTVYRINIAELIPATSNVDLQFLVSTDGGATYDNTAAHYAQVDGFHTTGNSGQGGNTSLALISLTDTASTGIAQIANQGFSGEYTLFNPASSSFKQIVGMANYYRGFDSAPMTLTLSGLYLQTTAVNAFRIKASSGNLTSGTITCVPVI